MSVSPFLIAKYELSQAEWKRVMGTNPSNFTGDMLPVEQLSWDDIQEFEKRTGLTLPTEAQWEYACRAGTTTPFSFGETVTTEKANYNGLFLYGNAPKGEYRRKTVPVTSFFPNAFGLFNVHGNVGEWCEDVFDYYSKSESANGDVAFSSGSGRRVARGGSWVRHPALCRSASRTGWMPLSRASSLGCRLARPLP